MTKKVYAYLVTWRDSSTLRGWQSLTDDGHEVATIESIGWLVRQDKRSLTLTASISESGLVDNAITIPREAVVKMRRLNHYVEEKS